MKIMNRTHIASELVTAAKEMTAGLFLDELDWNKVKFSSNKKWTFRFEGGGWNFVLARSKKEAVVKAEKEYGSLGVRKDSFKVPTKREYNSMGWTD